MTDWTLRDLVDDIEHVAELQATAKSFHIPYNDNRFNHSELVEEIDDFINAINEAVDTFQSELRSYAQTNWDGIEARYGTD